MLVRLRIAAVNGTSRSCSGVSKGIRQLTTSCSISSCSCIRKKLFSWNCNTYVSTIYKNFGKNFQNITNYLYLFIECTPVCIRWMTAACVLNSHHS